MTPVVMAIIFFCTVVPIGVMAKLAGKDLLQQNTDATADD